MSILNIIISVILALSAAAGLCAGLVKGYANCKSGGAEFVSASLLTVVCCAAIGKSGLPAKTAGIISLVLAVAFIALAALIFGVIRFFISRTLERREDDLLEPGAAGVINRLLGGVTVAVNFVAVTGLLCALVYAFADMCPVQAVKGAAGGVISGAFWQTVKPYLFDFVVLGIINIALRHGYFGGLSSFLMGLVYLAVLAGCAFGAYAIVFNAGGFANTAQNWGGALLGVVSNPDISITVAKWLLVAVLFLSFFVLSLIIYAVISKLLTFPAEGSKFFIADGILGAILNLAIFVGVMLLAGAVIQPLCGLEFMQPFTSYFSGGAVSKYFYYNNLLTEFGLNLPLPVREWFAAL